MCSLSFLQKKSGMGFSTQAESGPMCCPDSFSHELVAQEVIQESPIRQAAVLGGSLIIQFTFGKVMCLSCPRIWKGKKKATL